jgi:hypothetical protein
MPRKQGRWSAEDQRRVAPESTQPPPEPPPELEPVEADIWRSITAKLPGDWFAPETVPMLKELCRHIRHANDLAVDLSLARYAIQALRDDPKAGAAGIPYTLAERLAMISEASKSMERLLRTHGYQSERIGNLATKLRLTNQAKVPAASAARKARDEMKTDPAKQPWNDWGPASDRPDTTQ